MAENSDLWNVHPLVSIRPQNVSDVTSLSSNNILDSSYKKADHMNGELLDHTSEVRKKKLGDRITTLHQLVCPFGKTDTTSVFMEAIGYIRFLHGQIEELSYPHPGSGSENMWNQQSDAKDKPKDLRSRGLCLVPVSFTQPFGKSENAAD